MHAQPATYAAPVQMPSDPAAPVKAAPAGDPVSSPMVGVIYRRAEPGAPEFCKVGDQVSEGDTLFLIEAMKTFNPVRAPRSGKVVSILVDDGSAVEFGELLLTLE